MLNSEVILLVSFAYVGLLFAIAYQVDKQADMGRSLIGNPYIYALSLAVYCTAWTFYGSVGRAASTGVGFLPIYLGPTLMALLNWYILRKMIRITKVNRITSIADFIGSRYGKSMALGGLVTVVAVVGIIPYISLQLKAISTSVAVLWPNPTLSRLTNTDPSLWGDTAFYIALLLATFAILFGTRHLDATEHHEGLVAAIAFESVVKLFAFLVVGLFVTYGIYDGFGDLFAQAAANPQTSHLLTMQGSYTDWLWLILLSMLAILFLPRQFHMAVVENVNEHHLNKAIWLFPLYLLIINIFVLPIALGGLLHFGAESVDPDTFVLAIPMAEGQVTLAMIAFVGGLSASTSMVIVATVALTTMISNDLVMPILLRWNVLHLSEWDDLGSLILAIRRSAIVLILLLGYSYYWLIADSQTLVSTGLISFAAVAQFAPAMIGGMYWKGGSRFGAISGVSMGFIIWIYTLLLPSLAQSTELSTMINFVESGPFGLTMLKPYALFGLEGQDPISHAMVWSMFFNLTSYTLVSLLTKQSVLEHSQATLFVDVFKHSSAGGDSAARFWRGSASVQALRSLLGRFLGPNRAEAVFAKYAEQRQLNWTQDPRADAEMVNFAERQLAGAIGAASARAMVSSVVKEEPLSISEVMSILDETSQVIAYSHQLEEKSRELEAATTELRAANEQLKQLDRLKDDFISTVTHELRTPLTSIRAFSEILFDNPELEVKQRVQFASIILKESERLTRLINQVLDLSKIEAGRMEWVITEVDLRMIINDVVISMEHSFQEQNVTLEIDLPSEVPQIETDRDRIMQVLLNLVSNAIKFCDREEGLVEVSLEVLEDEEAVQINVQDNGIGIRPEDQKIIFEKFRQVGDTLTDKPQGTGLGLPICRRIVNYFGGTLWVKSAPDEGSTFSFTLPIKPQISEEDTTIESVIETAVKEEARHPQGVSV